ncbi:MAG TPA: flagellar protein FliT [Buttiauxella sp.]|jgi:flagellar protein FliT
MTKTLTADYEMVYQLNLSLLEMARQGEWDGFIERAENYVVTLQKVINNYSERLTQNEQEEVHLLVKKLIENEEEITRNLQNRLDVLKTDISSLNRGKKCNQAYSSSFTSTLQ